MKKFLKRILFQYDSLRNRPFGLRFHFTCNFCKRLVPRYCFSVSVFAVQRAQILEFFKLQSDCGKMDVGSRMSLHPLVWDATVRVSFFFVAKKLFQFVNRHDLLFSRFSRNLHWSRWDFFEPQPEEDQAWRGKRISDSFVTAAISRSIFSIRPSEGP